MKSLQTNTERSWTSMQIAELSKALAVTCIGQNAYGSESQFAARMDFWIQKLEDRFTVDQVLWALDRYTDRRQTVPVPADIINILDPEKPRITQAEFIHAKKQWEQNGYHTFGCKYFDIVKDYEAQESEGREKVEYPEELLKIAGSAVKKIS